MNRLEDMQKALEDVEKHVDFDKDAKVKLCCRKGKKVCLV